VRRSHGGHGGGVRGRHSMSDLDLDLAFTAFELSADLEQKLEQPTRPTRHRAGPKSTNTRDADVAEKTNRPSRKRTR